MTTSTSEKIHTRYKNTNVYNKQDFSPAVQSMSQVLANPRLLFQGPCNDSTPEEGKEKTEIKQEARKQVGEYPKVVYGK